jgi:hypothetical protein
MVSAVKRILLAIAVAFVLGGCSSTGASGDATEDEELVTSRCEREYGAKIKLKVDAAKEKLAGRGTPYAANVVEAIDRGRVKLLPMCKMTRLEFDELAKDSDLSALGETREEQYRALRRAEAPAMRTVHALIYGFQWEDRIYLSTGMSDARMAETLAHEVRHVERAAHTRNYDDQRVICVEETAAFEAEIEAMRAELTDADRREVARTVRELYGLDRLRADTCTYR